MGEIEEFIRISSGTGYGYGSGSGYGDGTEEQRLQKFREHFPDFSKEYPAKELFVWHHVLTGSCKAGRESFCRDNGIDIENDTFTIHEFVALTRNSYGGETIKKLLETD